MMEFAAVFYAFSDRIVGALEVIQNKFMRLAFRAFRDTPLTILRHMAYLEPFDLRLRYLRLRYFARFMYASEYHPLYQHRGQLAQQMENRSIGRGGSERYLHRLPSMKIIRLLQQHPTTITALQFFADHLPQNLRRPSRPVADVAAHVLHEHWDDGVRRSAICARHPYEQRNLLLTSILRGEEQSNNSRVLDRDPPSTHLFYSPLPISSLPALPPLHPHNLFVCDLEPTRPVDPTPTRLVCYTDGSLEQFVGGSGAALYAHDGRVALGNSFAHPTMILACELQAVAYTFARLRADAPNLQHLLHIYVYIDNRAALQLLSGVALPRFYSMQQLVRRTITTIIQLRERLPALVQIHLMKVAAHSGHAGNDDADRVANRFRRRSQWHPSSTTRTPFNATLAQIRAYCRVQWQIRSAAPSSTNPHSRLRAVVPRLTRKFFRVFRHLTRNQAATIISIISEHMRLNHFVWRLRFRPDIYRLAILYQGRCKYCRVPETVNHVLFVCRRFLDQRRAMMLRLRRVWPDYGQRRHFNEKYVIYGYFYPLAEERQKRHITERMQIKVWQILVEYITKIRHLLAFLRPDFDHHAPPAQPALPPLSPLI